jgi:bifunctional pyridoxal-dependent enzyme with beta-cystathionase and maltose regulon repressor activities
VIDLGVPSVAELHKRRSEKWALFDDDVLSATIAEPGDVVAFATPAYPPFFRELSAAGMRLAFVGLTADGAIDLDELDEVLARGVRVLVLANPHNPTGRVLSRVELEATAERCASTGTWVLADEIHAPLVLPGGGSTTASPAPVACA